jgi:glutathione S-transferase
MMSLIFYGHPFSSYCQKVLIALYENEIGFEFRVVEPGADEVVAQWTGLWPLKRFPLLVDGDHMVAESSIIIEHLDLHHRGSVRMLPDDPAEALDVRFMDRFFDHYVMNVMQVPVAEALRTSDARKDTALAEAKAALETAYGWLDRRFAGKTWAMGDAFTLADCAAAPSLFYADWVHEIDGYPNLRSYRSRLLTRPSFRRAVEEARPFRPYFPLGAPDRD